MNELGLKSEIDANLAQKLLPVLYRFVAFCNGGCWTSHHDGKLSSRSGDMGLQTQKALR